MKTGLLRVLTAMCCAVLFIGSCGNPWVEKIVAPLFDADEDDVFNLIKIAGNGDTMILSGTFSVSSDTITIDKDITILAPAGETLTFNLATSDHKLFTVKNGGKLTLGGSGGEIVLDGGAVWVGGDDGTPAGGAANSGRSAGETLVDVWENSTFIMNSGVTLQNNVAREWTLASAIITYGEVIINGGIIQNCKAWNYGTIHIDGSSTTSPAKLTIRGGSITGNGNEKSTGNVGGSIFIDDTGGNPPFFEWIGGSITNNAPNDKNHGSIVVVGTGSTLIWHGHESSAN
jgi:hypothetical protein